MVTFNVLVSPLHPVKHERTWFIRANRSHSAGTAVWRLWKHFEKTPYLRRKAAMHPGVEIDTYYPQVADTAEVVRLSEKEWRKFYKEALRWPHLVTGKHRENPAAFTFFPDVRFNDEFFGEEYMKPTQVIEL
jgi:hypothetical protein